MVKKVLGIVFTLMVVITAFSIVASAEGFIDDYHYVYNGDPINDSRVVVNGSQSFILHFNYKKGSIFSPDKVITYVDHLSGISSSQVAVMSYIGIYGDDYNKSSYAYGTNQATAAGPLWSACTVAQGTGYFNYGQSNEAFAYFSMSRW